LSLTPSSKLSLWTKEPDAITAALWILLVGTAFEDQFEELEDEIGKREKNEDGHSDAFWTMSVKEVE
jgi:hypothetical protein